jgi:hypothetical protein
MKNTDHIDLAIYKPSPDKEGYSCHSHNITYSELAKAIEANMPAHILGAMEYYGLFPTVRELKDKPLPGSHGCPAPYPQVSVEPGTNEGYLVSIHIAEQDTTVWMAKSLSPEPAFAAHLLLINLLHHHGTGFANFCIAQANRIYPEPV